MWLTYVDESGNTGAKLDDPNQPYHVIAAISVREDVVSALASHIDQVAAGHFGTTERTKATELHASQLKSGDGSWKGVAPAKRIAIYEAVLAPLAWDGVFVAHTAIYKPKLALRADRRPPHLWALQFLIEKLNAQFAQLGERTLLVADETTEHEQFALDLLVNLQTGQPRPGLDLGAMTQVIDTVHFVRSETNRGVQLADLVAYLRSRIYRTGPTPSVEQDLWTRLVAPHCRTWREPWPA